MVDDPAHDDMLFAWTESERFGEFGLPFQDHDAALLDFLRQGGRTSELSPQETVDRILALCSEKGRFDRLLAIADSEPPRVRALLGAIGETIGKKPRALASLRASLNPLSHFDFGILAALPNARTWQAKETRSK